MHLSTVFESDVLIVTYDHLLKTLKTKYFPLKCSGIDVLNGNKKEVQKYSTWIIVLRYSKSNRFKLDSGADFSWVKLTLKAS